jgi:flavin reductase (DIM6/NTAB) family NADH-FMN oxidoreductase RutF
MGKISWNGGALLAPVPPCLVTCKHGDTENVLTVAWTGILNTKPPRTYIAVRPERFSYELIKQSGVFVINLTTADMVKATDYCGVVSGKNINKFEQCGLKTQPATKVDVPVLTDSPLALECVVREVIPMETHHLFVADIVAVDVEETLVDKEGKLHLNRAGLAAYAHGEYFALGDKLGKFGFSVQKKKKKRKRK